MTSAATLAVWRATDGAMATASQVSKAVLRGNAGLLRFSQQDYSGALEEFEAAAAADHTDAAAVNNAAICQLLSTQVGAATSSGLLCFAPICVKRAFALAPATVLPRSHAGRCQLSRHSAGVQVLGCGCAGAQRCARAADGCAGAANAAADAGLRVHAGPTVRAG